MAHLIYKPPLIDEKTREKYIQTHRALDKAKSRGDIDVATYKVAKKNLVSSVSSPRTVSSPGKELEGGYFDNMNVSSEEIVRMSSFSSSSGSTTDRSSSVPSSGPQGLGLQLTRTKTSGSTSTGTTGTKKTTRKGTIFDRNNVGRLVFNANAQSEGEREALKEEAKQRKQLKRLIHAYEISQQTVSSFIYTGTSGGDTQRQRTPTPIADEEYDPKTGAISDVFYSTRPLSPPTTGFQTQSTSSTHRKRNFNFFRWTGTSRKNSQSSSAMTSPIIGPETGDEAALNTIAITPRTRNISREAVYSSTDALYMGFLGPPARRVTADGTSTPSTTSRDRSASIATHSNLSQYSTAPSSFRHTGGATPIYSSARSISTNSTSPEGAILASRMSNDTLRSYSISQISTNMSHKTSSGANSLLYRSDTISSGRLSLTVSTTKAPKESRTVADFFLRGGSGGSKKTPSIEGVKVRGGVFQGHGRGVPPVLEGRPSMEAGRPGTGSGKSINLHRRRHSISSDHSFALSAGSPRPSLDKRSARDPRESGMFVLPLARGGLRRSFESTRRYAMVRPGTAEAHNYHDDNYVMASPSEKEGKGTVGTFLDLASPTAQQPPSPEGPLPSPPSSTLLDAFVSLLEEYSVAPRLFSFSHNSNSSTKSGIGSFISAYTSQQPATTSNTGTSSPTKPTDSDTSLGVSSDDSCNEDLPYSSVLDGTPEELTYVHYRRELESIVWFLSAWKWLSCGRLLFSPAHHLLCMAQNNHDFDSITGVGTDMTILDLDGPPTGGWSWHMAYDYPAALIYNITTSKEYLHNHGISHMQPINHRLVLVESRTSLKPLESNFFDVITARTLPRTLQKNEWIPLFKECHRLLKPDGYLELTIVNPVLSNMGPVTKQWIAENILAPAKNGINGQYDLLPSESVLHNLRAAGLTDIYKCQVWMPAGSIGDEFSSVTSRVGRYFYDELFSNWGAKREEADTDPGITVHHDLELWNDPRVQEECVKENTVFQWLRCHARKGQLENLLPTAH